MCDGVYLLFWFFVFFSRSLLYCLCWWQLICFVDSAIRVMRASKWLSHTNTHTDAYTIYLCTHTHTYILAVSQIVCFLHTRQHLFLLILNFFFMHISSGVAVFSTSLSLSLLHFEVMKCRVLPNVSQFFFFVNYNYFRFFFYLNTHTFTKLRVCVLLFAIFPALSFFLFPLIQSHCFRICFAFLFILFVYIYIVVYMYVATCTFEPV